MTITAENSLYVWRGSYAERHAPEQAGWTWAYKRWTTHDHKKAAVFEAYFDDQARTLSTSPEVSRRAHSDFPVPCREGLAFLPYQKAGVEFLVNHPRSLLADEMGLGKTIQAIGLINACPDILRVLIVCPASLKLNWKQELERWLTLEFSLCVLHGSCRTLPNAAILIANYDIIHKYQWPQFDLVVYDEAQYLKNPAARRSKHALAIRADRVVALTGTPIMSRPLEIYTILKKLDPDNWPGHRAFGFRYCAGFQTGYGEYDFSGASNLDELHSKLVSTVMLRRLKKDVLTELPPKRRQIIELPADGKILKSEAKMLPVVKELLGDLDDCVEPDEFLYEDNVKRLARTKQDAFENLAKVRHETALAKVPQVLEFVREALESNEKVVIFAHHRDVIQDLWQGLLTYGAVAVTGEISLDVRGAWIADFQKDPKSRVFIGNFIAAGTGITLTAASHVIFAELDWVPATMTQCEDRCHRIGQKDSVLVQHLVLEGSIDAHIARTLVAKQTILGQALDGASAKAGMNPVELGEVFKPVGAI